jgi:hypothetical protein
VTFFCAVTLSAWQRLTQNIYLNKNELDQAWEHYENSLEIMQELGDLLGEASCSYTYLAVEFKSPPQKPKYSTTESHSNSETKLGT